MSKVDDSWVGELTFFIVCVLKVIFCPFAIVTIVEGFLFFREMESICAMTNNDSERLLQALRDVASTIGRTPVKSEFSQWRELKRYFGSWEKAVRAAGLESANSSKQHDLRASQRRESKRVASDLKDDSKKNETADTTNE